ncbi:MAG: hypothetical protein AAGF23_26675, partial [Acidobacteriota bacterium]
MNSSQTCPHAASAIPLVLAFSLALSLALAAAPTLAQGDPTPPDAATLGHMEKVGADLDRMLNGSLVAGGSILDAEGR